MNKNLEIERLKDRLKTQFNHFTKTPLFCIYERETADDPKDGKGWPTSIFLTQDRAAWYMEAVGYRLRNPYIYVRSPGEDSELHDLIQWLLQREAL